MFHLLHQSLCVVLSAALLLTNGLPMAVQHAHPVGKNLSHHTHEHGNIPIAASRGSIEAHDVLAAAPSMVTEVTEHIHLLWLGMEFTLPATKGHKPNTSASVSAAGLLARLADQGANDAHSETGVAFLVDFPLLGDVVADTSLPAAHADLPRDFASLPLCDSARHARSGVQLI